MANDYRTIFNAATGEETKVYLTDEEQAVLVIERTANLQKLADRDTAQAAVQADFAELKAAKLQTALDTLTTHQTKLEGTPTNGQVIAAVLYLVKVMIVVIRVVSKQV